MKTTKLAMIKLVTLAFIFVGMAACKKESEKPSAKALLAAGPWQLVSYKMAANCLKRAVKMIAILSIPTKRSP